MTQFNAPAYDIERPTGQCAFTGKQLQPGDPYVAALVELDPNTVPTPTKPGAVAANLGFKRLDISIEAWNEGKRPDRLFSYWRSTVRAANEKKKLFVDDEVLMNLFRRLADTDQPQRLAFRFVLTLILMRKRLLKYEGTEKRASQDASGAGGGGQEWWKVIAKGDPEPMLVLNPQLDETQIQQVTEQLGEILEAEL
jgi:hypothetical protein